jgi:hypothetical protein
VLLARHYCLQDVWRSRDVRDCSRNVWPSFCRRGRHIWPQMKIWREAGDASAAGGVRSAPMLR